MKRIPIILCTLVLAAFCVAQTDQTCPDQTWLSSADVPFAFDPNQAPNVLGYIVTDLGREWSYDGYGCEPDGQPMVFSASKGVLQHPTPYTFTLRATQQTVGVDYYHITVADVPPIHQDSIAVTGTVVVLGTRANRPPVLCGGAPR